MPEARGPLKGFPGFRSCQKRALPFFDKRDFAPTRASVCASAHEHTLSAQSIFRDVHAAAKNGLHLIRRRGGELCEAFEFYETITVNI